MKSTLAVICGGLLLFAVNCGSSPSAPSSTYHALVATWTGTTTIGVLGNGIVVGQNVCHTSWIVGAQTNAAFSGTFTLSGGSSSPCVQATSFTGTVTPDGAATVSYVSNPSNSGCVLSSSTPLAGVVTGSTWTLQQTNHFLCANVPADQIVTVALTKT